MTHNVNSTLGRVFKSQHFLRDIRASRFCLTQPYLASCFFNSFVVIENFMLFQTLKPRSNFDLQRPTIYQINGNSIRIKMHFSELRQMPQVWRYIEFKSTSPQISSASISPEQAKMSKNVKSSKNPKTACGGFHFHLPVIRFDVPVRNLVPSSSL